MNETSLSPRYITSLYSEQMLPAFHRYAEVPLYFQINFRTTPCRLGRSPASLKTLRYGFAFWRQRT